MIRVLSASHYFHRPDPSAPLPKLDERVEAATRERHRRIDRFVQLSLLGAGECAKGQTLATDCGLYLATDTGPIGSNKIVLDAIRRDGLVPMPFSFIATLGSGACFYVAKDLALTGEALLVARPRGSFKAALRLAAADLEAEVVSQALVGAVEECLIPFERQQALLRLSSLERLAEGSHWVLLERGIAGEKNVSASDLEDAAFDGYAHAQAAKLTNFLLRTHPSNPHIALDSESTGRGLRLLA